MEMWQLALGVCLALIYLAVQVLIFVFNWGRIYENPQPPSWQCGYHKLTLLSCILNFVVAGGIAIGFVYGILSMVAR